MADFPIELTNAQDDVTDVLAKHLNNLEEKVGIDASEDENSIDYKLKNPDSINPGHKHSAKETANYYAADSVGTDDYAVTLDPAVDAYTTGMIVNFKAGTINTGACTLALNGMAAKAIKKNYNQDLANGDIKANQI
ncbi:hypothetical protein KJ912_01140, partial [Patescibacteria group bacterium]|nr:hypothetical protein [Patescibacteria group bacterium]